MSSTEQWTFAGIRVGSGEKRITAWIDPDGKERWYAERSASYALGGTYEVTVTRSGETITMHGSPTFAHAGDGEDDRLAEWEIKSESAQRQLRRAAAERKAKKTAGVLDEASAELCAIAAKLGSFDDVDRLAASVRQRLYDAWGNARKG